MYRIVSSGSLQAVRYILTQGADVNLQSKTGETALHQAVDLGLYEIVHLLLLNKADPNIQQNDGESPLHIAAFKGDHKMIILLLEFSSDPNLQASTVNFIQTKRSPLHYAVDCNYIESALALVNEGGDIYLQDKDGISPFDLASSLEMEAVLKSASKRSSEFSSFVNPFNELGGAGEGTTYLISDLGDDRYSLGETHPQALILSNKNNTLDLKEIFIWLETIKLEQYYEMMIDAGYDNSVAMMHQMKGPMPIIEQDLAEIGIDKVGHRKRILWKLEESLSDQHKRKKSVGVFKCCGHIRDGTGAVINVPELSMVLQEIGIESCLKYFIQSGYDSYEILIAQFSSPYGLTKEILSSEVNLTEPRLVRKFLNRLTSDVIIYKQPDILFEEGKVGPCELCAIL